MAGNGAIATWIGNGRNLLASLILALVLFWQGGKLILFFVGPNFMPSGIVTNPLTNPVYQAMTSSGNGASVFFINLFYFCCYFIIGAALWTFILSPVLNATIFAQTAGGDRKDRVRPRRRRQR
jgi:hypothetical protein